MTPSNQSHNCLNQKFISELANRLNLESEKLAEAACWELGYPISFIRGQLSFVAHCLAELKSTESYETPMAGNEPGAAFLFPSNTEGAMPLYILSLAASLGFHAQAKLSQRCPGVQACLEHLFDFTDRVRFHKGTGQEFLSVMLDSPLVQFIQVFGDDAWIGGYEGKVKASGKTLAFDGPGKDPVIVLPGADLVRAVEGTIKVGLFAGGAACMSPERFLVHVDLYEPFLAALKEGLAPIIPLNPNSPDAVLGYLYSSRAAERLREQIAEARQEGAKLVLGGKIEPLEFGGRTFYACAPTILIDVPPGARLLTEESFGPVFPIQVFHEAQEAVAIAENCPYGLTATVFGPQTEASLVSMNLRSSHVIVYANETMLEGFKPEFWGSGGFKRSGWIWETQPNGIFAKRTGYRPLRKELLGILQRTTKEVSA